MMNKRCKTIIKVPEDFHDFIDQYCDDNKIENYERVNALCRAFALKFFVTDEDLKRRCYHLVVDKNYCCNECIENWENNEPSKHSSG